MSPKQEAFVREYLVDLNATQAAIRAGYSAKTARQVGAENLSKPAIAKAINAGKAQRAERLELKADDVLRELQEIAFAKPGTPEAPQAEEELDPGPFGGALERLRGVTLRYEHKLKALELLGKHLMLFTDKVEHKHSFADMTDEQLEAKYRAALAKASAQGDAEAKH